MAGRRGELPIQPGDSVNPDTFGDGGSGPKDGGRRHFDAKEAFMETSVGEEIYI